MAQLARRLAGGRWGRAAGRGSAWELGWSTVAVLGLTTLVLGTWGFAEYDPGSPLTERAYRTLQLAVFESGDLGGAIPWQLEVARIAAPTLAAYSALRAAVLLSRDRLDLLHARRSSGHVIVCGLGQRGTLLTERLRAAGHAVVAVEHDRACHGIDQVRRSGAAVVVGDATDPLVLERAGVRRATHLISLCGRPAVDAEVALAARRSSATRREALSCRLEVEEPVLADLLDQLQLGEDYEHGFRLDLLDVWGAAARALIRRFPPASDGAPRIAVVGLGRFGGSVVAEVARRHHAEDSDAEPFTVAVVDPRGDDAVDALVARLPHLRTACRFEVSAEDASSPAGAGALKDILSGPEPPGAVYVCIPDEAEALAVGLQSRSWLPAGSGVVVVQMLRHGGLADALEEIVGERAGIHAFAVLDAALTPELVLGGRIEQIARALHDEYRRVRPDAPGSIDWDQLPAGLRESTRDQARHVGLKLRAVHCRLAPLGSWDATGFTFTDREVEQLAVMEHRRWLDERRGAGWTSGHRRRGETSSPYLVPWDELPDDIHEIDRAFVRALPAVLADAGFEIRREAPIEGGADHGP